MGVRLARLRAGSVTPSPRAGAPGRARGMIRHGTIYALPDLARRAEALHERSVRVMGTVSSYDPEARRARVTMADASLWVDLRRASGADPPPRRVAVPVHRRARRREGRGAGPGRAAAGAARARRAVRRRAGRRRLRHRAQGEKQMARLVSARANARRGERSTGRTETRVLVARAWVRRCSGGGGFFHA